MNKKTTKNKPKRITEESLFMRHNKEGIRIFGVRRWENTNIGWATDDGMISSKVYGDKNHQADVLTSTLSTNGRKVYHETREY